MIKPVIFDVDGTLVDTVDMHAEAWQRALKEYGKEVEFSAVRAQIGKGGDQLMPVFLSREELDQFGEELEQRRGEIFKQDYLPKTKAFPRVRELVERIQRDGKRVVLASSAKREELEHFKR
jgi:beta-phosphoglucomutase-like phosphatase (HAD superfamily)